MIVDSGRRVEIRREGIKVIFRRYSFLLLYIYDNLPSEATSFPNTKSYTVQSETYMNIWVESCKPNIFLFWRNYLRHILKKYYNVSSVAMQEGAGVCTVYRNQEDNHVTCQLSVAGQ